MHLLAQIVAWLNALANALGQVLLAPIAMLPGWLSATLVSAVTGVLLLAVYKYTSNQHAIKRVRDDIKAHLLSLKLFKDNAAVAVIAQGRIIVGAFRLAVFALVPMLVMLVPVCLLLGQLSLWYESRPLHAGEEALVRLKLNGHDDSDWPDVQLVPSTAAVAELGPVCVYKNRELYWNIKAKEKGYHRLTFKVGHKNVEKQIAIGDGFMRVSLQRPGLSWSDRLLHPWEQPFDEDSPVKSIEIVYPERDSWINGTGTWMIYWFAVSMVAGFCFRGLLKVNI